MIDEWRISDGWFDVAGRWNTVNPAVRTRLRATIDDKLINEDQCAPLPVWVVTQGEQHRLNGRCELILENSEHITAGEMSDGFELPKDLPIGCHQLIPLDGGPITTLFVSPRFQAPMTRAWGWAAQLYGIRSSRSWGIGDLGDLAKVASWAKSHGADVVSHNPLGDTVPISIQEPSPYFTSSRRFPSLLYLAIEDVPGAMELGDSLAEVVNAGRELNTRPMIDRDEVFRLKLSALKRIWELSSASAQTRELVASAYADSDLLEHATFNALAQHYGCGWTGWERRYAHPRSRCVDTYRHEHRSDIEFWLWVQCMLADQHAVASKAGAVLMNDLPVGFASDGADAWVDQDSLALDWRIGAPPDEFNSDGQDWGIVPYLPQKLRAQGYEPWVRTLRRVMGNTGMLRIDHVMGMFRLFVVTKGEADYRSVDDQSADAVSTVDVPVDDVPTGEVDQITSTASRGAYLYHYGTEMLDIALIEAARAGVTVVGEDLGTVEDDVRHHLSAKRVPGYRVGWFEEASPRDWPADSIGSISTHDLPTIAGLVTGADARTRHLAGLRVDPADDRLMLARFQRNFTRQNPAEQNLVGQNPPGPNPPDSSTDQTLEHNRTDVDITTIVTDAYESLADAGSLVVLASLEDACCVVERPNIPGTVAENPNWRRPLPVSFDDIDSTLAPHIATAMSERTAPLPGD